MCDTPLRAPWLRTIARVFLDIPVYAVGGAVRNTLMGLPVSDMDLCGPALPETVMKLCEDTPVTARLRAAHFGTVELHIGGHMAEYTTFRQDSYRTGHQPVAVRFADTLEEDALRRDFSVNALYTPLWDITRVIDPTGGLPHLREKILHTVTEDPDQVLKDDGLRILRAVRFQAELGFSLTPAVLKSATKYAALLDEIAPERKRDELTKLLTADIKYPTLSRTTPPVPKGLSTLVEIGAWPKLFGTLIPMNFTAFAHAETLDTGLKLALLYHRATPVALAHRMETLHYAKKDAKQAYDALSVLQEAQNRQSTNADLLRYGLPAAQGAKRMLDLLTGADCVYRQASARMEELLIQTEQCRIPASVKHLAVGGDDLLILCRERGLPVERMGKVLYALWQAVANGRVPNTRRDLLYEAAKRWIDSTPCQ